MKRKTKPHRPALRSGWVLLAAGLVLVVPGRGEEGARAVTGIWEDQAAPPPPPAREPAPEAGLAPRIEALEKALSDLEAMLGQPRGLRARQPFERRLGDAETRLDRLEKKSDDLESRMRRLERRK